METTQTRKRIALIGAGQVGGAAAYALIQSSLAAELLLVDTNIAQRDAQVRDLSDVAFATGSGTRVRAATYHEAGQESDVVVITAGSRHTPGQSFGESAARNVSIVRNVVSAMTPFRKDAVLLVVSNPVDLLTSLAGELARLPRTQVFGSGTFLESARLRGLIADHVGIAANSIDMYVVGVHGENQVPAWSTATVGGVPLDTALPAGQIDRAALADECKHFSDDVIRTKGSTPFGIGAIIASLCASVLLDRRNVRPVSHFVPEFGCCVSMPAVLGRQGIVRTIQMPLAQEEGEAVAESAGVVKKQLDRILEDCTPRQW
ncbi:lactate dehydrogenase/glycoside hydrolase [Echria macrotheca]|uniref:Lactate dehydrogenase/glycoside hydrolase n=1 Tax=Echria macrotheca TaxID=438768 RepID=A0AAJ0BHB6_9PEZI|nr:lactate dehydrogenase/glycoside hydrolase [Echria macrotheca]